MSLKDYKEKRDPASTPEPIGQGPGSRDGLSFVVQKHYASSLHYDFRLELEGTLKSWAVPKGPSMDPSQKHLAVMVEDHPYDYKDFEGIIPEGNYGAGRVAIWDVGTYHSRKSESKEKTESLFKKGLRDGHFAFILDGKRLKGEFALIRLKKDKKNWLLIKKNDELAIKGFDISSFSDSVSKSSKSLKKKSQKQ